jgi:hypothetical protein
MQVLEKDGERGRNRTFNLLIKSQLLCQLSYAPFVEGKNLLAAFVPDLRCLVRPPSLWEEDCVASKRL